MIYKCINKEDTYYLIYNNDILSVVLDKRYKTALLRDDYVLDYMKSKGMTCSIIGTSIELLNTVQDKEYRISIDNQDFR